MDLYRCGAVIDDRAGLAFSPDSKFVYVADQAENAIAVYKVH